MQTATSKAESKSLHLSIADPQILSWWTLTDLLTDSLHQSDAPLRLTWCS